MSQPSARNRSISADTLRGDAVADERIRHVEQHRSELIGYCYRMLGSAFEAEDAVQETLIRAWQGLERFEGRAALRSWLYRIATNICLDMLRGAVRRGRAMDFAPPASTGTDLGAPLPQTAWVQPIPDQWVVPPEGDPAEMAVLRESIRLAFIATLQHLPPRQRAVLILRDVLSWSAAEVAHLLDTTVASVNSALQRARTTLAAADFAQSEPFDPLDAQQSALLSRYVSAFERHDVETLVSLLHEDVTTSMPPFAWWLRGLADVRKVLLGSDGCRGDRMLPTVANGSPAFGQYRRNGETGLHEPFALVVVGVRGGKILETTTYLHAREHFPLFGLPARLES